MLDRELKKGSAELLILSLLEDRPRHIFAMTALGLVRDAQHRDDEAEELFRSAIDLASDSGMKLLELHPLELDELGIDEDHEIVGLSAE